MEVVNCLMCGHADRVVRYRGHDRLHRLPGQFSLVECTNCHFVYLSPRPDNQEILGYYPSDYLSFRPAMTEERSLLRRLDRLIGLRKRSRLVASHSSVPVGTLLDIGSGTGDFLWGMREFQGWKVRGVEPHAGAADRSRRNYGLEVDVGRLEDVTYPKGSFDAVTLWDVLEHLASPRQAVARIYDWLRPGGILVFGVPNRESTDAALFGRYWAGLDIPRHFSVFSSGHTSNLVVGAGFEPPLFTNFNGSFHSFVLSMRFWLTGDGRSDWLRSAVLGSVSSIPFRAATFPYFRVLQALNKGTTLVVVARKAAGGT